MIGAGTTHSVELEKYLKTKIERMGHMLVVPNTPPSTPLAMKRRDKQKKNSRSGLSKEAGGPTKDRKKGNMQDSVQSLMKTDEEEMRCGDDNCKECEVESQGTSGEIEDAPVGAGPVAVASTGIETQPSTPAV